MMTDFLSRIIPLQWYEPFCEMLIRGVKASLLILLVILFRMVFKKAPSWSRCVLWAIVFAQLLIPFQMESSLSAYNYIPESGPVNVYYEVRTEKSEMMVDFPAVPGYPDNQPVVSSEKPTHTSKVYIPFLMAIWSVGIIALLIYFVVSTVRVKMRTRTAVLLRENVYLCDEVHSPFVFGLFRPHIYLSSSMDEEKMEYVVAHEKAHLKRGDQWWKLIGYFVMCIYWMNPLVWISYILFCKDLELACDEKVIKDFDLEGKKAYSAALLDCSMQKKMVFAGPLAFGEVGVKERVKNVINYKRPAFWVILSVVIVCIAVGVAFLTSATPEYQIKITIPAGSKRGVYYSEEEICPKRSTLKLSCGDHLGDTLVEILPVEVQEENAYDEDQYLTPGMPAEFEVEKGAWFKIGITAENLSDEDVTVYVNVKNVDVRIADKVSTAEKENISSAGEIEIQTPVLDLSATTGADGSTIYYADQSKIIFGGYYGLFVYEMDKHQIIGSVDLEPIGCSDTQGENACEIRVAKDGSKVFLHPMSSAQMYVYDAANHTMQSEEYNLDGYDLYENQYSGDEVGKYASYDDGGETRYVVLVNDFTIGELGCTKDVLSSYQIIFSSAFNELSDVISRVGLENALLWNNTADLKEGAEALIKMASDETGEYEIYGIMSARYGTYGLLLNDKIDGEDNWNFEYVPWCYTGAPEDEPVLEQSSDGEYVFSYVYKAKDDLYWRKCILDCGYQSGHMGLIPVSENSNGRWDHGNDEEVNLDSENSDGTPSRAYIEALQEKISADMVAGSLPFVVVSAIKEDPLRLEVGVLEMTEENINTIRSYETNGSAITIVSAEGNGIEDLPQSKYGQSHSQKPPEISVEDENMGVNYQYDPTTQNYIVDGDMVFQYKIVLSGDSQYTSRSTMYIVLANDQTVTFDEVDKSYHSSDINDQLSGVIIIGVKDMD